VLLAFVLNLMHNGSCLSVRRFASYALFNLALLLLQMNLHPFVRPIDNQLEAVSLTLLLIVSIILTAGLHGFCHALRPCPILKFLASPCFILCQCE